RRHRLGFVKPSYVEVKTPFMPNLAWLSTVHLKECLPFDSFTVSVIDLPCLITGVLWPAIAKSCLRTPLLTSLKTTVPCGALLRESLYLYSVAVTVTVVFA